MCDRPTGHTKLRNALAVDMAPAVAKPLAVAPKARKPVPGGRSIARLMAVRHVYPSACHLQMAGAWIDVSDRHQTRDGSSPRYGLSGLWCHGQRFCHGRSHVHGQGVSQLCVTRRPVANQKGSLYYLLYLYQVAHLLDHTTHGGLILALNCLL